MQHLDDGVLTGFLDGERAEGRKGGRAEAEAHLATCAECQARLEAIRATRDRAKAILRSAAPSGARLSFDEILERKRQKAANSSRRYPLRSLAWAASIMLALSVGWYARELQLRPSAQGEAILLDSRLEADTALQAIVTAPQPETPALVAAGRVDRPVGARANDRLARADEFRAKSVDVATNELKRDVPAAPDESALGKVVRTNELEAIVVTAARDSQPVTVAATAQKKELANVAEGPAPAAALDENRAFAFRKDGQLAQTTQILGRPPLTAPGLEVIDYLAGETQGSIRVRQRMGTGILEIHQQRAGTPGPSGPSASRALTGPGVGGLVEGIQVRLSGPVSYDSLRALVAKLK